jgi:nucleoid DNA-binding protein
MMDELIKRVTEKTGLSQDQAKAAAQSVIGFLKEKLPAVVA